MRLIDADAYKGKAICNHTYSGVKKLINIDDIPTAYDVDKVVEELEKLADENYKAYCIGFNSDDRAEYDSYTNAIEIVKQGGVNDDVCEWKKVKNSNSYKCNTHAEIYDSRVLDWCICPYCSKKIKVVE